MVVSCIIEFDQNPYGTYFAGQTLTGKITLQSDKVKQVKGVALKIKGFAHTHWTEGRSSNRRSSRKHFRGHEDYLASITYLLGSEENNLIRIEPGIHSYNFACRIPEFCPSSFEGLNGHIRYTVKVVLIRPWKFDQSFTHGFTVLKVADLNYDSPILRVPATSEICKTFCCGPCSSEPLKLNVSIPQTGFVPGQNIPVTVLVTNDSSVQVEEVRPALVMIICYYSQTPYTKTKMQRSVVTKLKGEPVLRHCKKLFHYELPVPATPPTCLNLCRIIQVAYQVEVEAKVKLFYANQVACIPVTIGNVPFMDVMQQQPRMGMNLGANGGLHRSANVGDSVKIAEELNVKASGVPSTYSDVDGIQVLPMLENPQPTSFSPWSSDANIRIVLKINGFAHTYWTTSTSQTLANGKTETVTTNYIGHEDYIATATYLLGSEENIMVNIEPGTHIYNFACFIPTECPSSFEAIEGHIRYTVRVELIRPWRFNQTYTQGFTVLKPMDLNYESPMLRVPVSSEISKTFCCGPCSSQPLKLSASLQLSGFVPGQNIPISILITNDSSIKVEEVKVSLVMLVCFYSQTPMTYTLNTKTLVSKFKGDSVPRNCKKLFNYELPVPATPPTAMNTCRIIQIAYQVEVEAKTSSLHANQVVCIPVTIGNVPLLGVVQQQPTASTSRWDGTEPTTSNRVQAVKQDETSSQVLPTLDPELNPPSPWSADANIPPPSYEEAAHMVRGKIIAGEDHDYGNKDFAPRYPVFHIQIPTGQQQDKAIGQSDVRSDASDQGKTTWL